MSTPSNDKLRALLNWIDATGIVKQPAFAGMNIQPLIDAREFLERYDENQGDEARRKAIIELARNEVHPCSDDFNIDNNAELSEGDDNGTWVSAWVWVSFAGTPFDKDSTCSDCGDKVPSIIGCPDGAEICQACFDAGRH